MLPASNSAPNSHSNQVTPKPVNWRGVTEGMSAAVAAARNGKLDVAEIILNDVLEFAPAEISAWKLLARIQRKRGQIDAGIASARRALQLQALKKQYTPAASITLARLIYEQGEHHEAMQMLNQLLKLCPDSSTLLQLKQEWSAEAAV